MQLVNLTLRQKLGLLLALPLLYLLSLTIIVTYQQYQLAQTIPNASAVSAVTITVLLFSFAIGGFMLWFTHVLLQQFLPLLSHSRALAEGQWEAEIHVQGTDEPSQMLQYYATIQSQLRDNQHLIEYYQRMTEELKRVFSALANGNLDENVTQEYTGNLGQLKTNVNNAIQQLNSILSEIKEVLRSAAEGCFDSRVAVTDKQGFFKELADYLNGNLSINQNLAEEVMHVFAAVSIGDLTKTMQQEYTGHLLQLKQDVNGSMTKLNTIMTEIQTAVEAASGGVLDKRINIESKSGFFKQIAQNFNNNLDINQNMIQEVMRVFAAISAGDLTQSMNGQYSGILAQLKNDVNASVQQLNEIMGEIRESVNAAGQGVFDKRLALTGKQGFFRDISENLNRNLDTNQKMVEELMRVFAAMAIGDLTQTMQDNYQGRLAELKKDVNKSVSRLNDLFEELMHIFSAMASGDLTQMLQGNYEGRLSELKHDINSTIAKLNDVMAEVGQASDQVSTAATEVQQGNISLSQRTEQQAAALEQTASSMQEMTYTVQQNADNAEQANQLSLSARKHAEDGGKVVNQTVTAMAEINKSSKKVSDIITVIDEIAFQTNLLALNAAVEAARAGEQGRGFAVVATEVRNLAQRSASAAKEIKTLIQDSVAKVDEGSALVDQSGKTLEEIMTSVKKVSDIVAEIAAASREQSTGILQVNQAVTQMDEMTQQNAALVEELSNNSDSMRDQVASLSDSLNFFTFNLSQSMVKPNKVKQNVTQKKLTTPTTTTAKPQKKVSRESLNHSQEDTQSWESF